MIVIKAVIPVAEAGSFSLSHYTELYLWFASGSKSNLSKLSKSLELDHKNT